MAIPPESHTPGAPYRLGVRRPTQLLREILDVSKDFQVRVGRELTVNATDLAAMELVLINDTMGPTELARRLGLSTAAVTAVVDRLVALGHVTRAKHPTDRRAVVIEATPTSIALAMSTIMPVVRAIESTLDEFDDNEQDVISRYLARVADVYRGELTSQAR